MAVPFRFLRQPSRPNAPRPVAKRSFRAADAYRHASAIPETNHLPMVCSFFGETKIKMRKALH
jgi:hypothetical protein